MWTPSSSYCEDDPKTVKGSKKAGLQKDNVVKLKSLLSNGDTLSQRLQTTQLLPVDNS